MDEEALKFVPLLESFTVPSLVEVGNNRLYDGGELDYSENNDGEERKFDLAETKEVKLFGPHFGTLVCCVEAQYGDCNRGIIWSREGWENQLA